MNKITTEIFERAYQSYLCGADTYTYKFSSKINIMIKKYLDAIKFLEQNKLIIIKLLSEDKAKISLTENGIEYGNNISI